jgi:hypothetical protein
LQFPIRFEDCLDQELRQLLGVRDGVVELALPIAGAIGEFDHRSVMGVTAADDDVLDARLLAERLANFLHHPGSRSATDVGADNGQLVVARADDERLRHERIEHPFREGFVPRGVAPHRRVSLGSDVALADTDFEGVLVGGRGLRRSQVRRGEHQSEQECCRLERTTAEKSVRHYGLFTGRDGEGRCVRVKRLTARIVHRSNVVESASDHRSTLAWASIEFQFSTAMDGGFQVSAPSPGG